jgi:hypothetical protein
MHTRNTGDAIAAFPGTRLTIEIPANMRLI